jgi:hypothetical protein
MIGWDMTGYTGQVRLDLYIYKYHENGMILK